MLLRIVIEAQGEDAQGIKEDLAMALERYGPGKVVEVAPIYRQKSMFRKQETGDPWERADAAFKKVMEELE